MKGRGGESGHANPFFVPCPRPQGTIRDAEQPGFFPRHETVRHKFSRQIGILRGKELRLAQSHHVSNRPWGQNQRATKCQGDADPHPSPVLSTLKKQPAKGTGTSHEQQGSRTTKNCPNANNKALSQCTI